ncbi:hypothetical protein K8R47_01740 [archaeon]|nr:hypothetical protein [archaeon]
MIINFYEEFPDEKSLSKIKLVKFPSKLVIAAQNIKEFKRIKKKIKNKNIKEIIWWPILTNEEGYWLSPFSSRKAIKRIIEEAKKSKETIMWDAELPRNKILILKNFHQQPLNKSTIKNFFKEYGNKIYTSEYFPEKIHLEILGLSFNPKKYNNKMIKMIYPSLNPILTRDFIKEEILTGIKKYGKNNFLIGLGLISSGVEKSKKFLTPNELEELLETCELFGIKEVFIYRLGGLNKHYIQKIKRFV